MKNLLLIMFLMLVFLAAACDQVGQKPSEGDQSPTPVLDPTPTLMAGLPTSTGASAQPADQALESSPKATVPLATPTDLPTVTPTSSPTATPEPAARLGLGNMNLAVENYDAAVDHYLSGLISGSMSEEERQVALLGLGLAQLGRGYEKAAVDAFNQLLASSSSLESAGNESFVDTPEAQAALLPIADAYYHLGVIYRDQGNCEAAIRSFEGYLVDNEDMGSYILPEIASCYSKIGDVLLMMSTYELAVESPALPGSNTALRLELARQYLTFEEYELALEQYRAIGSQADTPAALGMANYLIGSTLIALGNYGEAFQQYREAVEKYPQAFESYMALSALLEIGETVDDYSRGVVDYYAQAYDPAVAALSKYLEENQDHDEQAHLYLAWSYEGLGAYDTALTQIDTFIEATTEIVTDTVGTDPQFSTADPSLGWMERGKLQTRSGNIDGAIADYQQLLEYYPDSPEAPLAAWRAAAFAERLGQYDRAVQAYRFLADSYPDHEDASEALFRAGLLSWRNDSAQLAEDQWQTAVDNHLDTAYGAASLIWLLRIAEEDEELLALAEGVSGADYYQLRIGHIADGADPFERTDVISYGTTSKEKREADGWIRGLLSLEDDVDVSSLDPALLTDGRLTRGSKLWQLGRRVEAKRELEALRNSLREDLLSSYQLSIFFQELGLYRSSILAALDVLRLANATVFDAPSYLGKLAYPTNYSQLVVEEAERYGFDPLLQFALIRQESLFESFATSSAAAQGLSQVIPDTGAFIAQRLNWPDFVNEDLYKPYVGIAFGAYYLDLQLDAFDYDVAAALSAYNGGPGNAARWFEEAGHDIDLYREIVDFAETREYIDRIYEAHSIYSYLYGR